MSTWFKKSILSTLLRLGLFFSLFSSLCRIKPCASRVASTLARYTRRRVASHECGHRADWAWDEACGVREPEEPEDPEEVDVGDSIEAEDDAEVERVMGDEDRPANEPEPAKARDFVSARRALDERSRWSELQLTIWVVISSRM